MAEDNNKMEQLYIQRYDGLQFDEIPAKIDCIKDKEEQDKIINSIIIANEFKIARNKKLPRFKQYKKLKDLTEEEYDAICRLGIWEIEDKAPHQLFITYGAKKYGYITHDGIVKTTIAGCNKKNVPIVINNFAKKQNCTLENAFNNEVLRYSAGNCIQSLGIDYDGRQYEEKNVYV